MIKAADRTGVAPIIKNEFTNIIQTKSDMFRNITPGALNLKIVTTKLTAPRSDEIPNTVKPRIQRSIPGPFDITD